MSSLRNVVKRKAHKERAQPLARRRLGLLEKHKDYVLRARDFHRKEDAIRAMREKAAMRNPDEFYFKMEHTRLNRGRHTRVEKEEWTEEEVRLMNSQDMGYIRTKWQAEQQKVERLQASLHRVDEPHRNKHLVFAHSDSDATPPSKRQRRSSSPEHEATPPPVTKPLNTRLNRHREALYGELKERQQRARRLQAMLEEMRLKHHRMADGQQKKVKNGAAGDDDDDRPKRKLPSKQIKERKR
ncbi:unnamed protein product [Closterium sp. Yama58-4]|nr:unnamed protein product [Closterium sp. Yama58-4]